MALRKDINDVAKEHQWRCERASMGRRKDINGKGVPYQSPPNLPLPRGGIFIYPHANGGQRHSEWAFYGLKKQKKCDFSCKQRICHFYLLTLWHILCSCEKDTLRERREQHRIMAKKGNKNNINAL
jgi:hypothetical protein